MAGGLLERTVAALCAALVIACVASAGAEAGTLKAGAGRADITPPTGYYFLGWARSDSKAKGVHTRLFARAMVLERDGRKVALVSMDVALLGAGLVIHATELLKGRGITPENVIVSASHTHGAQAGYSNFPGFNTVPPTKTTPTDVALAPADPQLYGFMVRRLAEAIRRADDDRAPAALGWGEATLLGLTQNRSIEAHLADHGILLGYGEGSAAMDPDGYAHTIDPEVHVLRVDKRRGRRRVPIGVFTTFANHGTVNRPTFLFYNADHHGSATRVVEADLRRRGRARGQEVVNVFGNADEGDVSSGLDRAGPAAADYVGRVEANATMRAWESAGRRMSRTPAIDTRWSRMCFCGQRTSAGAVDSKPVIGAPFTTGSEENRGPLYDADQVNFEGLRNPVAVEPQGHKVGVPLPAGSFATAAAISAVRIDDRLIVTVPGEATAETGRRIRVAVLGAAGPLVRRVVISGLANDYVHYFTTPEEYERQHYEGGATQFGPASSVALTDSLVELAGRMRDGRPAPAPYPYDSTNGVSPDGPPYGPGAERGSLTGQPAGLRRLERTEVSWRGGERGLDRPLGRPFVTVERLAGRRWRPYTSDLGLQILWSVDDGAYRAQWEAPLEAPVGPYRFVITANRYRLTSHRFRLAPSAALRPRIAWSRAGRVGIALDYPAAAFETDFTYRPRSAGARTTAGRPLVLPGHSGDTISIPAGTARDRFRNVNGAAAELRVP